jgi:hypothetical protein
MFMPSFHLGALKSSLQPLPQLHLYLYSHPQSPHLFQKAITSQHQHPRVVFQQPRQRKEHKQPWLMLP